MVSEYLNQVRLSATTRHVERSMHMAHYGNDESDAAWFPSDGMPLPIVTPWILTGTMIDRPWAWASGLELARVPFWEKIPRTRLPWRSVAALLTPAGRRGMM